MRLRFTLAAAVWWSVMTWSTADAEAPKIPTIGVVSLDRVTCVDRVRRGLSALDYVEGRTHVIELRWGPMEEIPRLSAELVRLKVDLIVSASAPIAPMVKDATTSIPIVMASSFYPVESGVIKSLAHPGGNVTGMTHFTPEMMAKRVQLAKELMRGITRIVLLRLRGPLQDLVVRDISAAGRQLGIEVQAVEVRGVEDFSAAFDAAAKGRAQLVMTTQGPFFYEHRARIAQLALKHRLPSMSGEPTAAEAGMLLFYGPDVLAGCERAARYVDRVLKGAKPADLPVEQPTKIDLVVNNTTAKALGLRVPEPLLLRADKVIQ